jgi:GNAT superfamily N-acetyltransferase
VVSLTEFVQYNQDVHWNEFRKMNLEYVQWLSDQLTENYQVDTTTVTGQTMEEYVDNHLESFTSLKPPKGDLYILEVDGEIAGMGAVRVLRDGVGEIKRMYNRPQYRGRGYGKLMLSKLLDTAKELGCTTILLDSAKFMAAAHHIYRSAGFQERGEYPESEPPEIIRKYWIFMEKRLN